MKSRFLVRIGSDGSVFSDVKLSGKFYDDEVLNDDENYFILVNGVVLNSEQLSGSGSFSDYVLRNFTSGGGHRGLAR